MKDRKNKLLKFLTLQNKYINIDFIAKTFGVSVRTIKNDLKELRPILDSQGYNLITKRGVGIKVIKVKNNSQALEKEFVRDNIEEDTYLTDLMSYLLDVDSTSINYMSEKFYVSKSSITNDIERIKKLIFDDFNIELNIDELGVKVVADEFYRQQALAEIDRLRSQNFLDYDGKINYLRGKYGKTTDYVLKILSEYGITISDAESLDQYFHTLSLIIVLVERYKKGKVLGNYNNTKQSHDSKGYMIASDINIVFDVGMGEQEASYITDILISDKFDKLSNAENIENKRIFMQFVSQTQSALGTDLYSDVNLMNMLSIHFNYMMHRIVNNIKVKNSLASDVYDNYRFIYDLVWLIMEPLLNEEGYSANYDEIGWLTIYIQAHCISQVEGKKILLIFKGSKSTGMLAKKRISNSIAPNDVIYMVSDTLTDTEILDDYDFIISMSNIGIEPNEKVVYISSLVSDSDMKNIMDAYISYFKSEALINGNSHSTKVLDIFDMCEPENMLLLDEDSMEGVLSKICDRAISKNIVQEEFYQSVIDREALAPTFLKNNIAFPHGSYKYVNEFCIFLARNKKAISWGGNKVDFIILICVDKKNLKIARDLFKNAYYIIDNKDEAIYYFELLRKEGKRID